MDNFFCRKYKLVLCPTKLRAVAWIKAEGFPGLIFRGWSDAGPGLPRLGKKGQLEPDRDGGNMMRNEEEPIRDLMQEDQRPTE